MIPSTGTLAHNVGPPGQEMGQPQGGHLLQVEARQVTVAGTMLVQQGLHTRAVEQCQRLGNVIDAFTENDRCFRHVGML